MIGIIVPAHNEDTYERPAGTSEICYQREFDGRLPST